MRRGSAPRRNDPRWNPVISRRSSGRRWTVAAAVASIVLSLGRGSDYGHSIDAGELRREEAQARAVFEANLQAIRDRDRDAYLATYLQSPRLVRMGPGGMQLGFAGHAAGAGSGWPDVFQARGLRVESLAPGWVFGAYRYRVRFGDVESRGISERLFRRMGTEWKIAVTTAFENPPGTPPPPLVIVGGTRLDPHEGSVAERSTVHIAGGRIHCVDPVVPCAEAEAAESLDVSGTWWLPGLVDLAAFPHSRHADPAGLTGDSGRLLPDLPPMADSLAAASHRAAGHAFLASGITTIVAWRPNDAGGRVPDPQAPVPRRWPASPWVVLGEAVRFPTGEESLEAPEAVRVRDRSELLALLDALQRGSVRVVRVRFGNPEGGASGPQTLLEMLGQECRRRNLALHVRATTRDGARAAIQAGAAALLGAPLDGPIDSTLAVAARRQGTAFVPLLSAAASLHGALRALRRGEAPPPVGLDERLPSLWVDRLRTYPPGQTPAGVLEPLVTRAARLLVHTEASVRTALAAGMTLVPASGSGMLAMAPGSALMRELEALEAAGCAPAALLRGLTAEAGRRAECTDCGTWTPGAPADLVVLNADPRTGVHALQDVRYVVRAGELRAGDEPIGAPR